MKTRRRRSYLLTISFDNEQGYKEMPIRERIHSQAKKQATLRAQRTDTRINNFEGKWKIWYDRGTESWYRRFLSETTGSHLITEDLHGEDWKEMWGEQCPEYENSGILKLQYWSAKDWPKELKNRAAFQEWDNLYMRKSASITKEVAWHVGERCNYSVPLLGWRTGIIEAVRLRTPKEREKQCPHVAYEITAIMHDYSFDKETGWMKKEDTRQTHVNSTLYIQRLSNIEKHHISTYENKNPKGKPQ